MNENIHGNRSVFPHCVIAKVSAQMSVDPKLTKKRAFQQRKESFQLLQQAERPIPTFAASEASTSPPATSQLQPFGYSSQKHLRCNKADIPSSYRVQKIAVFVLDLINVSGGRGR